MAGFEAAGPSERLRSLAILREMQRKLKEGANVALGLPAGASPAEARIAFLALTKQYHPAKFARLDEPTVRLANEVFLSLREAYEGMLASPPHEVRPPLQRDASPAPSEPRSLPAPSERLTATSVRIAGARAPRADETPSPVRPPATHLAPTRPLVPARTSAAPSTARAPLTARPSSLAPPSTARAPLTARPSSLAPPSEDHRPATLSADHRATAPSRSPEVSERSGATRGPDAAGRTRGPDAAGRSSAPPATSQLQVRFSSRPPPHPAAPTAPAGLFPLLQQGRWAEARTLMQERVASEPGERRHLAYLAYVRGCEAVALGKLDDARRELTRALAIEPALREASAKLAALTGAVHPGSRK